MNHVSVSHVRPRLGNRPRIGVTLGEEGGIGREVMIAALNEALELGCDVLLCVGQGLGDVVRGDVEAIARGQQLARVEIAECSAGGSDVAEEGSGRGSKQTVVQPLDAYGSASPNGRRRAFEALELMVRSAREGEIDAMVTGPVTKRIFDGVHPRPPGQTEFVAWELQADRFAMMLAGPQLRVVPVTTHVPLAQVAALLTTELIVDCGVAAASDLQRFFDIASPKIGVCGLNPHAGEGGLLGSEEASIIAPAIRQLQRLGVDAHGPLSADSAFGDALDGVWDVVLCMYHDQALGPLKTVCRRNAINFTCGLPVPRMSPDHGTAFEIAGKGVADQTSARLAVRLAATIAATIATNTDQTHTAGALHASEI